MLDSELSTCYTGKQLCKTKTNGVVCYDMVLYGMILCDMF